MNRSATPPPTLAGFTWLRELGTGGFADVHLYRQHSPSREVAIKVLRTVGDGDGAAALAREADALVAVAGHPSVVTLHGVGQAPDGRAYLVFEYCPIADLAAQVRRQPMPVAQALETMVQLCSAAETLHRQGLVHRDIKPGNIMVTHWSRPVLADFGATLPVGTHQAEGGEFSPLWAPPEQQQVGALVHPTLDVYALAATAWTLLAGNSPFEDPGDDNTIPAVVGRVRSGRLPELGRPDVPPTLVAVLRVALAPEAGVRTPSALALAEALREVQTELMLTPTPLVVRDQPTDTRPGPTLLARMSGPDDADLEATLPPGAAPFTWRPPRDAPTKRGIRPWVAALLVAVAVLVTVGGVSAALLGGGLTVRPVTPATTAKPQDPIAAPPAPTTDVVGKLSDGRVYWTWQPTKQSGMHYAVTLRRPDREDLTREVALSSLDVEAVPGRNCARVVVVGPDGRESAAAEGCVDVP